MTDEGFADDGVQPNYSFRPSAFGATRDFRLLDGALAWDIGRRSGKIPFGRIERVRMSYRPATLQTHRFVTEIWSADAPRLDILSASWKSMVEQADQSDAYRAFILELHNRLASAAPNTRFDAGFHPLLYWPGVVVFIGAGMGLIGLTIRAFQSDAGLAALLIFAFLLLFLWQTGNVFYRNRPGAYRPDAVLPWLLPRPKS